MQPPMTQPPRALPAGWIEQVDQRPGSATHGQTFYVDTATGHTQWEPPAAPPPATAPPPVAPQQPQPAAGGAVLVTVPPGMGPGMRVSKQRPDGGFDWFLIPEGAQPGTQFAGVPIGQQQQQQQPAAAATNPGASMYMQSMLQATASTEQRQQQPAAQQLQPLPAATEEDDALVAAGLGAVEALQQAREALASGRYAVCVAAAEAALTQFQNTDVDEERLMAREDVRDLIDVLERAEQQQQQPGGASPTSTAEIEATGAGFSAAQIAAVQAAAPTPFTDANSLIEALLLNTAEEGAAPAAADGADVPRRTDIPGFMVGGEHEKRHWDHLTSQPGVTVTSTPAASLAGAATTSPSPRPELFPHLKGAIHAGYLNKNRPKGLRLVWQRRYFVLTADALRYFEDDAAAKRDFGRPGSLWAECKGSIPTHSIAAVSDPDGGSDWPPSEESTFTITGGDAEREPYKVRADTLAAAAKWVQELRAAAAAAPAPSTPPDTAAFHAAPSPAPVPAPVMPQAGAVERQSAGTLAAIAAVQDQFGGGEQWEQPPAAAMAGPAAGGDDAQAAMRQEVVATMGFDAALVERVQMERVQSTGAGFASPDELVEAVLVADAFTSDADSSLQETGLGAQGDGWRAGMAEGELAPVPDGWGAAQAPIPAPTGPTLEPPRALGFSIAPPAPAPAPTPVGSDAVAMICAMGYRREQAVDALAAAGGDAEQAVEMLLTA